MNKDYMTWQEFNIACDYIAKFFKQAGIEIKNIYGIPRGGLIPAVRISHLLGIPLILDPKQIDKKTLVVDDIVDTGKTTEKYQKKGIMIASLWYNPNQCPHVPYYWVYQKTGKWIVFPWEKE